MKITVVWDMMAANQLFCSLLIEVSFICSQPLCQYCYNLHTIFKFVATRSDFSLEKRL